MDDLRRHLRSLGSARHVSVEKLVHRWQRLASEVSSCRLTVDEYINALTGRDALETVIAEAPEPFRLKIGALVAEADARFRGSTRDDHGTALSQFLNFESLLEWWWHRRPVAGPLSDFLDRRD